MQPMPTFLDSSTPRIGPAPKPETNIAPRPWRARSPRLRRPLWPALPLSDDPQRRSSPHSRPPAPDRRLGATVGWPDLDRWRKRRRRSWPRRFLDRQNGSGLPRGQEPEEAVPRLPGAIADFELRAPPAPEEMRYARRRRPPLLPRPLRRGEPKL